MSGLEFVSTGTAGSAGGSGPVASVQTANYTLALADANNIVEMNSGTAKTITVPPNSSVAFPIGSLIELSRIGAGAVAVVAGAAVTIESPDGLLSLRAQYSSAGLRKRATDEWVLTGDLSV